MNKFTIAGTSNKIWNYNDFLSFLIANQHGHVEIDIVPEAICLENLGVYNLVDKFSFKQINIKTWNPLENHPVYNILYKGHNFWFKKIEKINPELHTWNQSKLFYCLFGRPTASRLGLASHLYINYENQSHLHFSATTDEDELIQIELDKLLTYDINSIEPAGILIKKLPLLLSSSNNYTKYNGYVYADPLTKLYQDILIDIVVESHVLGDTFFPTEKTIRPMLLKKPFIIFGSRDYLCYLRQMGFKTFQTPDLDFWSEDYDGYEGKNRYIRILALIDELAKKSKNELQDLYQAMQPILDHNYNLLQTQSYDTTITKII
jgi:hypothetical protein